MSQDADVLSSAPVVPVAWVVAPPHALTGLANNATDVAMPAGVGPRGGAVQGEVVEVDSLDGLVAAINARLEGPPRARQGRPEAVIQILPVQGTGQGEPRPRPTWWN